MKDQTREIQPVARGRGRPRVEEPLERVSTRVPLRVYDEIVRAANAREVSVSMMVRHLLILRLPK